MPINRYFEVTEVRTIKVVASTVPDAIQIAEAGFNNVRHPDNVEGKVIRAPIVMEMHATEKM